MEWLADFVDFCLNHGVGGLALLGLAGFTALLALLTVLAALRQLGAAFVRGWRQHS